MIERGLFSFFLGAQVQIQDTAHTTGISGRIAIDSPRATIQVSVVIVTAVRRARPYDVRVAAACRARAAAAQIPAL